MSVKINGVVVAGKGVGVPKGGTTGQVLSKSSATDYDTKWIDFPSGSDQPSGITEAQVDAKISTAINGLIDGAPAAYDTLKEISDYIATDKSAAEAMNLAIGNKADKTAVPTKTSQLTNDSEFITLEELNEAIQTAIQATWEASY